MPEHRERRVFPYGYEVGDVEAFGPHAPRIQLVRRDAGARTVLIFTPDQAVEVGRELLRSGRRRGGTAK